jgi:hypothetical protein
MISTQLQYDTFLESFTSWVRRKDDVKCARLIGSRATLENPSPYIDLDVEFYSTRSADYRKNLTWVSEIMPFWQAMPDDFGEYVNHWSSRFRTWTIFTTLDGGIAVDFIIQPYIKLRWHNYKSYVYNNPQPIDSSHILHDSNNQLATWGAVQSPNWGIQKPSKFDYLWRVQEFWGSADRAIRYLGRGYQIESRRILTESLKRHIRQMMMWHAGASSNWNPDIDWRLHHIDQWASPNHLESLRACHTSSNDLDDLKQVTLSSFMLFRRIALEVAEMLDYPYPHDEDKYLSDWVIEQFEHIR